MWRIAGCANPHTAKQFWFANFLYKIEGFAVFWCKTGSSFELSPLGGVWWARGWLGEPGRPDPQRSSGFTVLQNEEFCPEEPHFFKVFANRKCTSWGPPNSWQPEEFLHPALAFFVYLCLFTFLCVFLHRVFPGSVLRSPPLLSHAFACIVLEYLVSIFLFCCQFWHFLCVFSPSLSSAGKWCDSKKNLLI